MECVAAKGSQSPRENQAGQVVSDPPDACLLVRRCDEAHLIFMHLPVKSLLHLFASCTFLHKSCEFNPIWLLQVNPHVCLSFFEIFKSEEKVTLLCYLKCLGIDGPNARTKIAQGKLTKEVFLKNKKDILEN